MGNIPSAFQFNREGSHLFEAMNVSDDVFWAMRLLTRTLAQERDRQRVQSKLTKYFKYIDKF